MCWLTAYLVEQWDAAADKAGVEAAPVMLTEDILNAMERGTVEPVPLPHSKALDDLIRAADLAYNEALAQCGVSAMDVPPAEPAQVFNYEKQVWETPGAVEPPKPEPCAIIPAADEYSTIAARLREIEAEKQAALERVGE